MNRAKASAALAAENLGWPAHLGSTPLPAAWPELQTAIDAGIGHPA